MGKYAITVGPTRGAARLALQARLYEVGGLLKDTLRMIAQFDDPECTVSLLHHHAMFGRRREDVRKTPVGVAIILNTGHMMAYVHPHHRGKGLGSQLVQAAMSATMVPADRLFSRPGDDFTNSAKFWKKVGVLCREFDSPLSLTREERKNFIDHRRTLLCRRIERVPGMVFERLYLDGLYTDQYGDEHNGLRGHLHALICEEWTPLSHLLFHFKIVSGRQDYLSLATVETRDQQPPVAILQLFVRPDSRRQGLGQEIIDRVKREFPDHQLQGYYTDSSRGLFERNGVSNLNNNPNDRQQLSESARGESTQCSLEHTADDPN